MKLTFPILILMLITAGSANGQTFKADVSPLIESSCIHCHDGDTDTGLDFKSLGHDLTDVETFRKWEKVFDRTTAGEMPPASEDRPDPKQLKTSLTSLKKDLYTASVSRQQTFGRVPARRLTKLEFGNTLKDLLLIENDVTSGIPDEVDSGSFDTVGSTQRISAVHMESYLSKKRIEHVAEIVSELAPRILRRNATPEEVAAFVNLAKPAIEEERDLPAS